MKINMCIQKISCVAVVVCLIQALPAKAEKLDFSLTDSFGRQVISQDYEGVPVFLEFGACW
jgi:cytochrome oxidase Cu insertion factor (SCO1/SenC/PrrC family)